MFFKHSLNGLKIILIVYVNDIILIEDNLTKIEILKIILAIEFEETWDKWVIFWGWRLPGPRKE